MDAKTLEPIRDAIVGCVMMHWESQEDLPKETEEVIDSVMDLIMDYCLSMKD